MSNKLKKVVAVLMTATMVMAMGMTVLAGPSATSTGVVKKASATDKNGNAVSIVIEPTDKTIDTAGAKSVLGNSFVEGMEVLDVVEVSALNYDFAAIGDLTITFTVPTVVETTNVAVLHYTGGSWKPESSKAGNGTITATFSSLSPVAFVVDKNTAAGKDPKSGGNSPKTGEFATTSVLAVLAVLAMGGAVVCYRKREEVR